MSPGIGTAVPITSGGEAVSDFCFSAAKQYGQTQFQAEGTGINHGAARVEKATLRELQAHDNETDVE